MQRSLAATAALLLSACIGSAQGTSSAHVVIHSTPEQIKKAAVTMFARDGYSLDSDNTTQLRISKPFSEEETAAYNTAHWTNQPVANCRHVQKFLLSRIDEETDAVIVTQVVCRDDRGAWLLRSNDDQKETQWAQNILAALKLKTEEANRPR